MRAGGAGVGPGASHTAVPESARHQLLDLTLNIYFTFQPERYSQIGWMYAINLR